MNYFNYFSEIEETFNRRRGKHLFLSPLDWALIEIWQQRGVPLHIVVRAIEKVFDGFDQEPKRRRRSVKSLTYCREEIEAQYEEWVERQTGKNGDAEHSTAANSEFSSDALIAHLENVGAELEKARVIAKGELRETLKRVLARLPELKQDSRNAEKLEESLNDLENLIDKSLLDGFDNAALKSEIEKQMASYRAKMDAETYKKTFDLMLLKRLREKAEIPRLSLFYL